MRQSGLHYVLALLCSASACSLLVSFDDLSFGSASGVGGAATVTATTATAGGSGGQGGSGPAFVVYVSSTRGDDSNDGLSERTPKATVGGGIEAARDLEGLGEIHVCGGTYDEAVRLDFPVALLGGYDCADWSAANQETTIATSVPKVSGNSAATLELAGADATPATVVAGFVVVGVSDPALSNVSVGVVVRGEASPTLRDNTIIGGAATGNVTAGSIGLLVEDAAPEVFNNVIEGGSGKGEGFTIGSVGVFVAGGAPNLHDNEVDGGQGRHDTNVNHVGLFCTGATMTDANALRANIIRGGTDGGTGPLDPGTMGIFIASSCVIEIVGNHVEGGSGPNSAGTIGIAIGGHGTKLLDNRIYSGDPALASGTAVGVQIGDVTDPQLTNNMILATASNAPSAVAGVRMTSASVPVLRHNTVLAHGANDCRALDLGTSSDAVVENNLLFSRGQPSMGGGIVLANCPMPLGVDSLRGNAVFGFPIVMSCGMSIYTGFEPVEMSLGMVASNNRYLRSNCTVPTDFACAAWNGCDVGLGCANTIFEQWSTVDDGSTTLWALGWRLLPNTPCALARSGYDSTADVAVDHYGIARDNPPSAGAHEFAGPCTP